MGKKWGWPVLVCAVALMVPVIVSATCDGDGICEPGENTGFCEDCNNVECGDQQCDAGFSPPENCDSCPTDCGYCDGHSCTSPGECFGGWCVCGVCDSSDPGTHCCSDNDCPWDQYGSWYYYCEDSDVYRKRLVYDNFCNAQRVCDLTSYYTTPQYIETCTTGCTSGSCDSCTSHADFRCQVSEQGIFWRDSCGNWEDLKEDCSNPTTSPWSTRYCKNGNVFHSKNRTYRNCGFGDTTCQPGSTTVVEELVEFCQNGCANGECLPGCSDDPACTSPTATGCSLDFVNRWWCEEGGDGCLDQAWETCTAGRCDSGAHQCVPGCTSNANCDDDNPCTNNVCTVANGECTYPPDPNVNGATCDYPGHAGIGDGQCNDGACDCHDSSADAQICDTWICGSRNDYCGVARTCPPGCTGPEVCNEGICALDCNQGQTLCGEECADTKSNPAHCGSCDHECPVETPNCVNSECVACTNAGDCNDNNPCTTDTCEAGSCAYENNNNACTLPTGSGHCQGGDCLPDCTDECELGETGCDNNAPWSCGENDADDCRDRVPGTPCAGSLPYCSEGSCVECRTSDDCAWDEVCNNHECEEATISLLANPASVTITAGSSFSITFTPDPDSSSLKLRTTSWPDLRVLDGRILTYIPGNDEVGNYDLAVEAFIPATIGDDIVKGATTVPVVVHCNSGHVNYGPCCHNGAYLPDESACTHQQTQEGETWWCQQGACEQFCAPDYQSPILRCRDNQIWEYDTCNQPHQLITDCPHNGQVCSEEGGAHCEEPPSSCSGEYTYECRGTEGVSIDTGCAVVQTILTCDDQHECIANDQGVECQTKGPCHDQPGTIHCNNACIDPLTSRTNCGQCNNECSQTEQCIGGSCELIPGCTVICDHNEDCGEGYVCVQAGSCYHSRCEPVDLLDTNQTNVEILAELLTNGLVQVESTLRGNHFVFTATNLGPTSLENVSIIVEVHKDVAAHASTLLVRNIDHRVLQEDPVLQFTIPLLETREEWTMQVLNRKQLDESFADKVRIKAIEYEEPDLLKNWNETRDALTLGLNSEYDGEKTQFHLTLTPNKDLGGLSIPLQIPKCMAEYAQEMELQGTYHIVEEDPLIVWQFDELNQPTTITFAVTKNIDEECKAQLRAMAMAQRIGKPLNPWLSLLLIPTIAAILVFFQRFTPTKTNQKKLPKKEYFALGREQGMSKEDLEREWRDYKRRF